MTYPQSTQLSNMVSFEVNNVQRETGRFGCKSFLSSACAAVDPGSETS